MIDKFEGLNPSAKNKHMKQFPARPLLMDHNELFVLALEAIKVDGVDRLYRQRIAEAYWATDCGNGYSLADYLTEKYHYKISEEDEENLHYVDSICDKATFKLEKEWFDKNKVTPPFIIGSRVSYNYFEQGVQAGLIESISEEFIACYVVRILNENDELTHQNIIEFESLWSVVGS